jgi:hypothetical protein
VAVLPVVMSNQGGGSSAWEVCLSDHWNHPFGFGFSLVSLATLSKNTIDKLEKGNIIKLLALLLSEC